ncbi:CPBP family intramembrane glutamic endopeptidase [Ekhidna sp.]
MKNPYNQVSPFSALIDLTLFLSLIFFVRTIHIENLGFWGFSIFKSISTVGLATLLLYYRKQSWKSLGLTKPGSYRRMLLTIAATLVGTIVSVTLFGSFINDLFDSSESSNSSSIFNDMEGNISMFFSIILFVWIESFLEELQDRGFSLNRFESLFAKVPFSTGIAVLAQAAIFGFRHSYDLSPRSLTTGLIGLVFGIVYVLTGRNLWPLIIAHIFLNTMSMIDRL